MILWLFGGNMNELHYFKKYLEEELQLAFSRSNPIESRDNTLDIHRITEIHKNYKKQKMIYCGKELNKKSIFIIKV